MALAQVFHEDPQVLHYGRPGTGDTLKTGMCLTIEPMINAGERHSKLLKDGWTVVTKDRSLSAQFEHTIVVTDTGCEILTLTIGRHHRTNTSRPTKTLTAQSDGSPEDLRVKQMNMALAFDKSLPGLCTLDSYKKYFAEFN